MRLRPKLTAAFCAGFVFSGVWALAGSGGVGTGGFSGPSGGAGVSSPLSVAQIDAGQIYVANNLTVAGAILSPAVTVSSSDLILSGQNNGIYFNQNASTVGPIASNITAVNAGATSATAALKLYPIAALDATDYVISVGTTNNAASLHWVTYGGKTGIPGNSGTCTLNAASPATCTVTVTASAVCFCSLVGTTAAIAAMNCAVSLSGTTLTVTAANAANANVNVICDR